LLGPDRGGARYRGDTGLGAGGPGAGESLFIFFFSLFIFLIFYFVNLSSNLFQNSNTGYMQQAKDINMNLIHILSVYLLTIYSFKQLLAKVYPTKSFILGKPFSNIILQILLFSMLLFIILFIV
jgi:hypothetical protein